MSRVRYELSPNYVPTVRL